MPNGSAFHADPLGLGMQIWEVAVMNMHQSLPCLHIVMDEWQLHSCTLTIKGAKMQTG